MSEKKPKATIAAIALAGFAALTAVGDAARSYIERQADIERAAQAEAARIEVDESIQSELVAEIEALYQILDEQDEILEDHDRAIWELQRMPIEDAVEDPAEEDTQPDPPPRTRTRKPKPAPKFDFAEPSPVYEQRLAPVAPR